MILGDVCTRGCRFCAVARGGPLAVDASEPRRIANAARVLGLRHVVVTSVTRDDLADGGAAQFVATIRELRRLAGVTVEVLIPDFNGDLKALEQVVEAEPDILAHNVETVPRLYRTVRPGASYDRSLAVLLTTAKSHIVTKSSLMLGLGETRGEVLGVLRDLRAVGCESVTLGQYLRPSRAAAPMVEFIAPATFAVLERTALSLGFRQVRAGPLVRSSYLAEVPRELDGILTGKRC